ncbi:hypothetical protein AGDE_03919 [Angomonas deanei]|nr:hypothetical protein AGDE_03919 [Angomonas deanei]|eukprot:EPY40009.1 hypothetical protein AGDE_03919 [Angomonas deanei]
MSGESVFDLVDTNAANPAMNASGKRKGGSVKFKKAAPPPTASTFGIHGTSAVVGNAGGEFTDVSVHPAKKPIGTFGREVGPTVDPANYLKKNEGPYTSSRGAATVDQTRFKKSTRDTNIRKDPVPSRSEKPVMGLKTDKNYVVANAVENAMAIPPKPTPSEPRPTERDDFGRVPDYLKEIQSEIQTRRQMADTYNSQLRAANERWSELSPQELSTLRGGLQKRWDMLNKEYQSKGFSKLETPSQKSHQEEVEKQLCALEFAMQKLSRNHVLLQRP